MKIYLATRFVLLFSLASVSATAAQESGAEPVEPAAGQEVAAAGAGRQALEAGVVAMVNGEPIYFEDLEARLGEMHSGQAAVARGAMDIDRLIYRLVNDALLGQEARALGLQDEPPTPERVERLRRRLAVERLDREEIAGKAQATEEEIRAFFEDQYRSAALHMATAYEQEQADEILALLREEGANFEAIAREHSVDPYAPRGGKIEKIDRIDMPRELAGTAFEAEPGVLHGPLRTSLGWSVIRVDSIDPADPARLEKLTEYIRGVVSFRKAAAARSAFDAELEELHPAEIDNAVFDAMVCERLPDARLLPKIDDPDALVVRIGDETISAKQLGKALQTRWKGVRNEEAALAAKPIVLSKMIEAERMWAEAKRRGYHTSAPVLRELRAFETNQIIPVFLDQVVGADIEISQEQIQAFYDENREEFPRPPRLHLGQITVADLAEARRMAELLKQGTDLAWLARQHSTDRFKESGGDRGWMVPSRGVDEVQDALYDAAKGTVLGPFGAEGHYSILKVNAREGQGYYSVEEASGQIRSALYLAEFQEALDRIIQTLRTNSEIEINEEIVASLRIRGEESHDQGGGGHHGGAPPAHGEH
jgi:parvulin-like peptidyl-prolyl isomerase